ncbi:MAG: rhomboid family intramembrane serine protease [Clostridia bacterium]|nr:rhomboid family intramembrane serine protease [Clostridia bacterium]
MKITDVLDDQNKKLKWWSRNWFFASTVAVIAINLLIYFFANDWQWDAFPMSYGNVNHWHDVFYFTPTWRSFFSSFSHANVQHVCLNMLCFLIAGAYIERKYGSISLFLTVIIAAYLSAVAINANDLSANSHGFSGVNYFLYAYIIVDYVFYFIEKKRNKVTTIFGAVVVALIYLASCFNGETETFSFAWYPYDLSHNIGHYSSFLIGLVCTLALRLVQLKTRRETTEEIKEKSSEDKKDNNGADNV